MTEPTISGAALSARFYEEAVAPILRGHFPGLDYSACLLGYGSEVLGFDDQRSRDHNWGPRLRLLLDERDWETRDAVSRTLSEELPVQFLGFPTNFRNEGGAWQPAAIEEGPVNHRVEIWQSEQFFEYHLGFDPRNGVRTEDWLAVPTQRLLEITAGPVFHDALNVLQPARRELAWYPADVWRYVLASQWQRIAEEEAFVGRATEVGDDLGSRIVVARLVRDLVRLWLLINRRYPPYSKWLGTAFAHASPPDRLVTGLEGALAGARPDDRERSLAQAYEVVAEASNATELAPAVEPTSRLHGRPYRIIRGERFSAALRDAISHVQLKNRSLVGAIDQFIDNTTVLSDAPTFRKYGHMLLDEES